MTKAEQEVLKRLNNRYWRLNNLYWIQNESGDKIKFRMNHVQQLFYKDMWWLNTVLKSRQHGMSTLINIMQLDQCLFNEDQTAGIIDKTDADAKKKLDKIRFAYDHLDDPDDPKTSYLGAGIKEKIRMTTANAHEIEFSNNSKVWAGTSLRGGTIQFLHISELGPIAFNNPQKAEEIRSGSLNTVHKGCKVVIESTHEGGKYGLNYEMIELAQSSPADKEQMSLMDWQFHFFAWFQDPKNSLPLAGIGLSLDGEQKEYFDTLERDHGIKLTPEQKHWYAKKQLTQKDAMLKEHPSTAEEALNAVVKGAIYGPKVAELRKNRQILDFSYDHERPMYTFWDLGQSDFTACWLIQPTGPEFYILNYFSWTGEGARFYASHIQEWERQYGIISAHYLPHDAENRKGERDGAKTWLGALRDAGLKNIKTVPMTPNKWIGINHLRGLLPRCYIHKTNCSKDFKTPEGRFIPGGLSCLEAYRTKTVETGGIIAEEPVHDDSSHGADALRTFAEAHYRGMMDGHNTIERETRTNVRARVISGMSHEREVKRFRRKPNVIR